MQLATRVLVLISCLLLLVGTACVNNPPTISSLTAHPETIAPGSICTITCTASDPDGDTLTYSWTEGSSTISGGGSMLEWTAPYGEGIYVIGVRVSDGKGGKCSEECEVVVDVSAQPTPTVAPASGPTPTPTPADMNSEVDPVILLLLGAVVSGLVVAINGVVGMLGQWLKVKGPKGWVNFVTGIVVALLALWALYAWA